MSNPYIGEIRPVGFNFEPVGWAFCDGRLLSIAENDVLFALIGTTYGGDGQTTFALPDLRGRVAVHQGGSYVIGEVSGEENHTLNVSQIPSHSHGFEVGNAVGTSNAPSGHFVAIAPDSLGNTYAAISPNETMGSVVTPTGSSEPHDNLQPFLVVNYVIAMFGIFPSQG